MEWLPVSTMSYLSNGNVAVEETTNFDGTQPEIPVDELFDILSHPDCRTALDYLLRQDDPVDVNSVISHLTAMAAPRVGRQAGRSRARVATNFYHSCLPKLVDANMLEYDDENAEVEVLSAATAAEPYLDLVAEQS